MKTKIRIMMYALMWATIIILLVIGLCSCSRKYIPISSSNTTVTITDTVTQTVPDSSVLRALFECDSLGRVRLREIESYKGKDAQSEVIFRDGELRVETRWRTQYIDRIKEVRDTTVIREPVEVIKEVKHIPAFFWWCFGIALGSVLLGIFKLLKTFKIL